MVYFRNLFPVLRDAAAFQGLIDVLVESIKTKFSDAQVIVGKVNVLIIQHQLFPWSTLLSMKFIQLINVKMPTVCQQLLAF